MDPETERPVAPQNSEQVSEETWQHIPIEAGAPVVSTPPEPSRTERGIEWVFLGPDGLRSGWSLVIWLIMMILLVSGFSYLFAELGLLVRKSGFTPRNLFFSELVSVLALGISVAVMAMIERRRILDYNLRGNRGPQRFFAGLATGFVALSVLVGSMAAGGWLHFHGVELSGAAVLKFGLVWISVFLLVGCFEEGTFRCYMQYTLTRGLNFWWALGAVALICGSLALGHKGNGVWGDYALAAIGLLPCLWLELRHVESSGFWQAAWVTSTLFGFVHTGNGGESWIGIFAAGAIGFVFCVSVRLTGSAWWAIGTHAGWDWGETYFYGTPDSGMVAPGHYLNTSVSGNALWSGGTAGPEGSLLVIVVVLLLLVWVVAVYRRTALRQIHAPESGEDGLTASM